MNYQSIRQAKAIEQNNKKRLLEVNPKLDEESGIYFLTRTDENGFKYAYIGQAVHILTRLSQHLVGYQHIDLSLKKHKLYSKSNPCGWKIGFLHFPKSELDKQEQHYIKAYADKGYQLRNKTSGSQGEGKAQIDDYKPSKGYRDGIQQGRKNLAKELSHIAEKHLKIEIREDKRCNKVSQKQYEKFMDLLKAGENNANSES
ncbi:MAG: GIY-YIG nuclease family protein [Lachnospira sp.]|nr:GIY-YIG nuclease family protein [Lachnospira sp.]